MLWVDRSGNTQPVDPNWTSDRPLTFALSPDDTRLAVSMSSASGADQLWVKGLPDGPLTRLTTDDGLTRRPVWSRDGSTIAYITSAGGVSHARTVLSDGSTTGDFEILLRRDRPVFEVVFTPDERGLLFREGSAAGDADVGYLDLVTDSVNDALLASQFNERAIVLSPDWSWLAYVSDVTGRDDVFVRPFTSTGSTRRQVSVNGGREPVWAHNGQDLFFRAADGWMVSAAYVTEPTFTVVSRDRLFDASSFVSGGEWHYFDISLDDERFLMLRGLGAGPESPANLILIQNWFEELRERLGG